MDHVEPPGECAFDSYNYKLIEHDKNEYKMEEIKEQLRKNIPDVDIINHDKTWEFWLKKYRIHHDNVWHFKNVTAVILFRSVLIIKSNKEAYGLRIVSLGNLIGLDFGATRLSFRPNQLTPISTSNIRLRGICV